VFCLADGPKPPFGQLVHNQLSGVLSITYDKQPKAICSGTFGDDEANVACFELYGDTEFISYSQGHQCDHESFWLDGISCQGDETGIQDCAHFSWGLSSCDHTVECIQLFCSKGGPKPIVPPKLSHSTATAVLSITYIGESRAVCDQGFDDDAAAVACFELYGTKIFRSYSKGLRCDYDDFWTDNFVCRGNEASISECKSVQFGNE
jgi:hypothetical protein